ncbi:MAG: hypothetical protein ACD_25C00168G0001 [uncultured bacterium]|nr:MAG: hypothetical protein ACD_25C00168G0001 [uncultured bacterium]
MVGSPGVNYLIYRSHAEFILCHFLKLGFRISVYIAGDNIAYFEKKLFFQELPAFFKASIQVKGAQHSLKCISQDIFPISSSGCLFTIGKK